MVCVHIYHKEAENDISSGCIAISATENLYNNQTIVSENFTGIPNRSEMTDTSRADTTRLIRHVFVLGEKEMNNSLRRC